MSTSPINGGWAARRAIVRWTWRTMRRQRRQYAVIVVLVAVVVAATVFGGAAAYNLAPAAGEAEYGTAGTVFYFERDSETMSADRWLAIGSETFGTIEPIGHHTVVVPGSTRSVDYRSQQLGGPFGGPMLELSSGRAPADDGEVAVTDGVADLLRLGTGDTVDLDGTVRRVVGTVENPSDLDDEFVLLHPSAIAGSDEIAMLAHADENALRRFGDAIGGVKVNTSSDVPEDVLAGVLALLASTVVLALVALVASATFTVIAQRRLAQLGMLSAIGASERHLRLSMLASGAVVGTLAGAVGAVAGLVAWLGLVGPLERIVAHRIDAAAVPWWIVLAGVTLAIVSTTLAAWWPARTMSRIPTVAALSGRMPRPASGTRSALIGPFLAIAGMALLHAGSGDLDERPPTTTESVLLIAGILALLAGVLLLCPILVRSLGRFARYTPVAARLALRDLSRYRARSSASLAAIALALGVPAVIVASVASVANATPLGNLADTQLVVRPDDFDGPFVPDAEQLAAIDVAVHDIADAIGAADLVSLQMVFDPAVPTDPNIGQRPGVAVDRRTSDGWAFVGNVYAATPRLLDALGLDRSAVAGRDVVTVDDGRLYLGPRIFQRGPAEDSAPTVDRDPEAVAETGSLPTTYSSLPQALIDPERATANGWTVEDSGRWLAVSDAPLDADQIAAARQIAARSGLVVESRDTDDALARVRLAAGALGVLLALAVLAATVGLIRGESSDELRTLTAVGASGLTRRGVTAVCAMSLALVGALLGVTSAYLALASGRVDHLTPLPWRDLTTIVVGTPLLAAAGGWLLAGREPRAIARRPLD